MDESFRALVQSEIRQLECYCRCRCDFSKVKLVPETLMALNCTNFRLNAFQCYLCRAVLNGSNLRPAAQPISEMRADFREEMATSLLFAKYVQLLDLKTMAAFEDLSQDNVCKFKH